MFDLSAYALRFLEYMVLMVLFGVPLFGWYGLRRPALADALAGWPFMGILFGLGLLWMVGDLVHRKQEDDLKKQRLTMARALTRIDMSSIVFFIGILLSVAVLEHTHILSSLAKWLDQTVGRQDIIVLIIAVGLIAAVFVVTEIVSLDSVRAVMERPVTP